MTALIIIGAVFLILLLISLLRFGVSIIYSDKELCVKAVAGPVRITVFPIKEKDKPEKKRKKREKTEKEEAEPPKKEKIDIKEKLQKLLPPVLNALGRLRRKLSIDKLTIHYTAAADDPCSAAMSFGYASAAIGAVMPLIENNFKIRERDVGADVTFDSTENIIYVNAQLTLAFWEIIYICLALLPLLKSLGSGEDTGKVDKNGQATNK
ncbi:MAG: DUF2953 domain-containing protein [Oscillospiraceae bacterium]